MSERVAVIVAAALLFGACGADLEAAPSVATSTASSATSASAPSSTPETESTTASASSTTTAQPTTAAAAETTTTSEAALSSQAEVDLRFDYGAIVLFERIDGVDWIWFDRYTFGDLQGSELQTEPRWEMATDWHGGGNVNPRLRAYPLSPTATILELEASDFADGCGDLARDWDFVGSDLPTLVALEGLVSLTFDDDQRVTLIRDQRTC